MFTFVFGHVLSPVIMFVIVVDVFFLRIPQYCCSDMKVTLGYGIWLLIKLKKKIFKASIFFFFFFCIKIICKRLFFCVDLMENLVRELILVRNFQDGEMFEIERRSR